MKIAFALLLTLAFSHVTGAALSEREAEEIATEAYIYGYPLVTMEITRRVSTNLTQPDGAFGAPMGQFANLREHPNADFKTVTAPNADTLYSAAWLDVSKEPYILSLPDEKGRYYLMPMLSGWTDVFQVPGTRTTGTELKNMPSQDLTGRVNFQRGSRNTNRRQLWFGSSAAPTVHQKSITLYMPFKISIPWFLSVAMVSPTHLLKALSIPPSI
jgi:hypothetical protein